MLSHNQQCITEQLTSVVGSSWTWGDNEIGSAGSYAYIPAHTVPTAHSYSRSLDFRWYHKPFVKNIEVFPVFALPMIRKIWYLASSCVPLEKVESKREHNKISWCAKSSFPQPSFCHSWNTFLCVYSPWSWNWYSTYSTSPFHPRDSHLNRATGIRKLGKIW